MNTALDAQQLSRPSTYAHTSLRPWWPWLLTAFAFPPAGYLAHAVAGRVDNVPSALLAGVVTGAVIGAVQWVVLRRRGVSARWIAATAGGFAAGLAVGAALVSYRTDRPALALMGAVSGLAVGLAQAATTTNTTRRILLWGGTTAVLWVVGWIITDFVIADYVEEQWAVFGISGSLTVAFLQSTIVGRLVPAPVKAVK